MTTYYISAFYAAGQQFSNAGVPLNGGMLYTYIAGTTTPLTTYSDNTGGTPNPNPIVLNAYGRITNEIWTNGATSIKFITTDAIGNVLDIKDNIPVIPIISTILSTYVPYTTLAASTGSSLVGYQPNGTGAVATTVQQVLRETVSIDRYGADPTGVADSSSAIALALASGALRLIATSSGTYSVSTVAIPSNIELDFCGATVNARTASAKVFTNASYVSGSDTNITIKNLTLNGQYGTLASVIGLGFQNLTGLYLEKVTIQNCGGNGIYIGASSGTIKMNKVFVLSCGTSAGITGGNSVATFAGSGIQILGGTADYPNSTRVKGVSLIDCEVYSSWAHGLLVQFADNVSVVGGRYYSNGRGRTANPTIINSNGVSFGQVFAGKMVGVSSHDNVESGADLSAKSQDIEVSGCALFNNQRTGFVADVGNTAGTRCAYAITGNSVTGNGAGISSPGHGLWITNSAATGAVLAVTIAGNTCYNNTGNGIYLDAVSYVNVTGNSVVGNTNSGIKSESTVSYCMFYANFCLSNTGADQSIAGSFCRSIANGSKGDISAASNIVQRFDRLSTFGDTIEFAKDGTPVGVIGHTGGAYYFQSLLSSSIELRNTNSTMTFYDDAGSNRFLGPGVDNVINLGRSGWRWATVYAGTGAINTSDEREKQQWETNLTPELRAWSKVQFGKFKFNDAVNAKGDKARWHFGVLAQRVKEAFESEGLDAFAYGVLCYDEWPDTPEVIDEDGRVTQAAQKAGNRYGVRYEEALALECAYLRSKLA